MDNQWTVNTGTGTYIGIDIGSTTAKIVIIQDGKTVYSKYERHFSQVRIKTLEMIREAKSYLGETPFGVSVSGSAGFCDRRSCEGITA